MADHAIGQSPGTADGCGVEVGYTCLMRHAATVSPGRAGIGLSSRKTVIVASAGPMEVNMQGSCKKGSFRGPIASVIDNDPLFSDKRG